MSPVPNVDALLPDSEIVRAQRHVLVDALSAASIPARSRRRVGSPSRGAAIVIALLLVPSLALASVGIKSLVIRGDGPAGTTYEVTRQALPGSPEHILCEQIVTGSAAGTPLESSGYCALRSEFAERDHDSVPMYLTAIKAHGAEPRIISGWVTPDVSSIEIDGASSAIVPRTFPGWTRRNFTAVAAPGATLTLLDAERRPILSTTVPDQAIETPIPAR